MEHTRQKSATPLMAAMLFVALSLYTMGSFAVRAVNSPMDLNALTTLLGVFAYAVAAAVLLVRCRNALLVVGFLPLEAFWMWSVAYYTLWPMAQSAFSGHLGGMLENYIHHPENLFLRLRDVLWLATAVLVLVLTVLAASGKAAKAIRVLWPLPGVSYALSAGCYFLYGVLLALRQPSGAAIHMGNTLQYLCGREMTLILALVLAGYGMTYPWGRKAPTPAAQDAPAAEGQ